MNDIAELFQSAYRKCIVDDDIDGAITLCRQILEIEPNHHNTLMLLANLIDDHNPSNDPKESYKLYTNAIRNLKSYNNNWWFEENPLIHLAIWERKHGSCSVADILLAIDSILGGKQSIDLLLKSENISTAREKFIVNFVIDIFKKQINGQ